VLVDSADEVERAVEAAVQEHVDALIVVQSGQTAVLRPQIVELATKNRLPAMYETSDWTYVGGLMAYGASIPAMYHRAAYYVDRILRGTSPADLPVEQPREFDFVINLQTARALGLTIPPHVLLQATEVIQ